MERSSSLSSMDDHHHQVLPIPKQLFRISLKTLHNKDLWRVLAALDSICEEIKSKIFDLFENPKMQKRHKYLNFFHKTTMKCFRSSDGEVKNQTKTIKSPLGQSLAASTSNSGGGGGGGGELGRYDSDFDSQDVSDMSVESLRRSPVPILSQKPNNLRVFTLAELKIATKSFSHSQMVGEGGFGCVYRGMLRDSDDPHIKIDIAVKQLGRRGLQGHKEWVTEVNVLGVVEHPNLVKLIGYCAEDDERGIQRLLVYEYMLNKSVEEHLSIRSSTPLPWDKRLKIAQDAACGLAYLHEEMDFQIIFRDFKSSNILLDDKWNAKLSDFGLARQGPSEGLSHVSTAVVGTIGYAAPEYLQTGRLTIKSDVFSYGVFLYELITGRRPMDRNRPKSEQKLLEWVRPHLSDIKKFEQILDPRLEGQYSLKSALKLAATANRCLVRHPKLRPKMSEVLEEVKQIVEATHMGRSPQLSRKGLNPKDASENVDGRESNMKRKVDDIKIAQKSWLFWRAWKPKHIKLC